MAAWMTFFSVFLSLTAVGGGVAVYALGHEAVADEIGSAILQLDDMRSFEIADYENLEQGDLCRVADAPPAAVPAGFRLDVRHADGKTVDVQAAREAVEAAMPMIPWSGSTAAVGIDVVVVDEDLHFEGADIAGIACGMDILIEERYLLTSTLPHEVGHVLGLPHEDGSYMQVGRNPGKPSEWAKWNLDQQVHLLQFQVAGLPWPERMEGEEADEHLHESGCGCGAH
ncbi:MAG: hypothetical protein ACPHID_05385 [Thermoplasmatota archaeon]